MIPADSTPPWQDPRVPLRSSG